MLKTEFTLSVLWKPTLSEAFDRGQEKMLIRQDVSCIWLPDGIIFEDEIQKQELLFQISIYAFLHWTTLFDKGQITLYIHLKYKV